MNRSTVTRPTMATIDTQMSTVSRATLADVMDPAFYKKEAWIDELFEGLFKIRSRESTIKLEIYYGIIHFISCFYCLAVIPQQMNKAGYGTQSVFVATAACAGIGSIILGLFANLPFVMAPPTVVTIFFSVFLQNNSTTFANTVTSVGSSGVIISGALLMLMGYRPFGNFIGRLIPYSLQAGTAIGIGLLTALAGMTDINFVTTGSGSELLRLAPLTFEIGVAIAGVIIICLANWYHIKGSFCIAIIICSLVYNFYGHGWPQAVYARPQASYFHFVGFSNPHVPLMVADLLFLYILYLNGLISSLSYLAGLTRDDGAIPRGRWVFLLSGIVTIASGLLTGAPVLISPESAAAIKEGAKTGLSACVCGLLFVLSILFAPIFEAIPDAGTSPILFMIGVLLFQNVLRVDWKNVADATPAFVVLFFIPFSFSVIQGVLVGYVVYIIVGIFTGSFFVNFAIMAHIYFPVWAARAGISLPTNIDLLCTKEHAEDCPDDDGDGDGNGDGDDDNEEGGSTDVRSLDIHNIIPGNGHHSDANAHHHHRHPHLPAVTERSSTGSSASHSSITNMINRAIFSAESNNNAHNSSRKNSADKPHARGRRGTVLGGGKEDGSEYMCMGFEGDHLFDISLTKLAKSKTKSNNNANADTGANHDHRINSDFSGHSDKQALQRAAGRTDIETGAFTSNPINNINNDNNNNKVIAGSVISTGSGNEAPFGDSCTVSGNSRNIDSGNRNVGTKISASSGTNDNSDDVNTLSRLSRSSTGRTSLSLSMRHSGLLTSLVDNITDDDAKAESKL